MSKDGVLSSLCWRRKDSLLFRKLGEGLNTKGAFPAPLFWTLLKACMVKCPVNTLEVVARNKQRGVGPSVRGIQQRSTSNKVPILLLLSLSIIYSCFLPFYLSRLASTSFAALSLLCPLLVGWSLIVVPLLRLFAFLALPSVLPLFLSLLSFSFILTISRTLGSIDNCG